MTCKKSLHACKGKTYLLAFKIGFYIFLLNVDDSTLFPIVTLLTKLSGSHQDTDCNNTVDCNQHCTVNGVIL